MRTLRPLWRAKGGLKGRNMGNNRVIFLFVNTVEMEWVIANGPWSFDKFLILLKRVDDDSSFSKVVFNSCAFWVQFHDLPPCHMSTAMCGKIGSTLGMVELVRSLMRDVAQPLCRGRKVWLGGAQEHWVSFKFE